MNGRDDRDGPSKGGGIPDSTVPPIVEDVVHSPGRQLEPTTRAAMESQFGKDFSRVRVHTNVKAAESARAVNALAYTVGRDVVFSEEADAPRLSLSSLNLTPSCFDDISLLFAAVETEHLSDRLGLEE